MDNIILPSDEHRIKKYCVELISGKYYCYHNRNTKDDYRYLCDFFDIIKNRLYDVGYNVEKRDQDKTIYAETQSELPSKYQHFNTIESKTVLYLVKKFLTDIKNINTGTVVYYKWNEILTDLQDTYKNNKEKSEIINILCLLKNLNVIDVNANKKMLKNNDENDSIVISIFPAIKHICNFQNLDVVEQKLKTYNTTKQSLSKETEEDYTEEESDTNE